MVYFSPIHVIRAFTPVPLMVAVGAVSLIHEPIQWSLSATLTHGGGKKRHLASCDSDGQNHPRKIKTKKLPQSKGYDE